MKLSETQNSLADALVTAITRNSFKSASKTETLKLDALRTFSNTRPARTNQFEVQDQLAGLEEKFRILNNDELADALRIRLTELSGRSDRWTPEILSLLLQLSDKPAQKTRIEDIAPAKPELPAAALTWSDILVDDPLDNRDGIWNSIDYAADSSDEDDEIKLRHSTPPELTPDSSVQLEDTSTNVEALIVPFNDEVLHETVNAQFWKEDKELSPPAHKEDQRSQIVITEAQLMREVVFMLLGLPTSVYTQSEDGKFTYSSRYVIRNVSCDTVSHMLNAFALLGNKLAVVRAWSKRPEDLPLQQTIQAALSSRVSHVNSGLSLIQARILNPVGLFTASLLDLFDQVQQITRFIGQIADVISIVDTTSMKPKPFEFLQSLFDETCAKHATGDAEGYEYMAKLFFECLKTYLKPVRSWMENGEVCMRGQVLFVKRNDGDAPLSSLWQEQFTLLYDGPGLLHAPTFLHLAAQKIFVTGKSVNFLKNLGQDQDELRRKSSGEPQLDYNAICTTGVLDILSPFSELFNIALDRWVGSMYHSSSIVLRERLESQCGLLRSLDALEYIYFYRNGSLSGTIASSIFERLDRGNQVWNDGSSLTDIFQNVFGPLHCIDTERLAVRAIEGSYQGVQRRRRSVKVLSSLRVNYTLAWPIANIVKQGSIDVYQRIFVFMTQVQRAKQMLERRLFPINNSPSPHKNPEETQSLIYALCHRLLWFTNILLTYISEIVLSPTTAEMRATMAEADDVDAMIAVHASYLSRLEDQCLISKRLGPIHQAIISLLDLVILFSDAHASHSQSASGEDPTPSVVTSKSSNRRKKSRLPHDSASDSDSEHSPSSPSGFDSADVDTSYISFTEFSFAENLRKWQDQFSNLHAFVTVGLRGVSRAGGEASWEMLAESLAVGLRRGET